MGRPGGRVGHDYCELIQATGLWMINHPNRQRVHNHDTDCGTNESEFPVTALSQAGRLCRRVILNLFQELKGMTGLTVPPAQAHPHHSESGPDALWAFRQLWR
jgi:hypothetical protein